MAISFQITQFLPSMGGFSTVTDDAHMMVVLSQFATDSFHAASCISIAIS